MKKIITVLVFFVFISMSWVAVAHAWGSKKIINENLKTYNIDLNGDGSQEVIEIEDRFAKDLSFVLVVGNRNRKKGIDLIDGLVILGKIRKMELIELNEDGQSQMVLYYDDLDHLSNIAVYQLKNNKLYKIFSASSEYGVDMKTDTVPRIRIGKPSRYKNSSNFLPDWDSWVWVGDKFVKD